MRTRHLTAHWIQAVLLLGLMSSGITVATAAQARVKLFTGEWYVTRHLVTNAPCR